MKSNNSKMFQTEVNDKKYDGLTFVIRILPGHWNKEKHNSYVIFSEPIQTIIKKYWAYRHQVPFNELIYDRYWIEQLILF